MGWRGVLRDAQGAYLPQPGWGKVEGGRETGQAVEQTTGQVQMH